MQLLRWLGRRQLKRACAPAGAVRPLVLGERAAVTETLAALGALCRPLAQVGLAVQRQLGGHAEGPAALGALVGFVAGAR